MRNRTRVGRTLLAVCLAAALTVALAACGRGAKTPTSSQGAGSSAGSASNTQGDEEQTQTLTGTLNLLDQELGLLVVVTEDGYCRFDLGEAEASGLKVGDEGEVTYTGELAPDSDELTAVVTALRPAEG